MIIFLCFHLPFPLQREVGITHTHTHIFKYGYVYALLVSLLKWKWHLYEKAHKSVAAMKSTSGQGSQLLCLPAHTHTCKHICSYIQFDIEIQMYASSCKSLCDCLLLLHASVCGKHVIYWQKHRKTRWMCMHFMLKAGSRNAVEGAHMRVIVYTYIYTRMLRY